MFFILLLVVPSVLASLKMDEIAVFRSYGVSVTQNRGHYTFTSDGLPNHEHGNFPNPDNPNEVRPQDHRFNIPVTPTMSDPPGCLPMGAVGMAINGVVLFNPYTAEGYNAVEEDYREVFDNCDGHPAQRGDYHYHRISSCLYNGTRNQLLGVAFDGYPIYGPLDETGHEFTREDLDFCHGRMFEGTYRYHMTYDFPYILGCYHGNILGRPPPQVMSAEEMFLPPPPPSDHDGCYANYSQPKPAESVTDPPIGGGFTTLTPILSSVLFTTILTIVINI